MPSGFFDERGVEAPDFRVEPPVVVLEERGQHDPQHDEVEAFERDRYPTQRSHPAGISCSWINILRSVHSEHLSSQKDPGLLPSPSECRHLPS
jgi:hypothetical protein